jgi:hypothetical protein
MDLRTKTTAKRSDSRLETVEQIHRPQNSREEKPSLLEMPEKAVIG